MYPCEMWYLSSSNSDVVMAVHCAVYWRTLKTLLIYLLMLVARCVSSLLWWCDWVGASSLHYLDYCNALWAGQCSIFCHRGTVSTACWRADVMTMMMMMSMMLIMVVLEQTCVLTEGWLLHGCCVWLFITVNAFMAERWACSYWSNYC